MYVYTNEDFGSSGVSRRSLQSRFTGQFFSTSRFTDTKNGRYHVRRHENKHPPPHPPPPAHLDLETGSFVAFEQEV